MGFDVRTYAQKKRKEEETGPELKAQVDRSKPGGGFDVRSYAAQKTKTDEAKSTLQKIAANLKTKTPEQRQADELWNGYDYNAEAERRRQAGGYTPASTEYRAVDTDTNRMTAQGVEDWKQELADRQAQEDNYVKTVSDVSSEEAARDAWKKMHPEWYNEDGSPVVNIYGTDINVNSDRGKDYWDLELKRRDAERKATEAAGYADKLRNGEGNSRAELDPVEGQYQLEQLKQQRDEMKNLGYPAERLKAIDEQISQLESDLEAIEYSRLLLNYSRLAGDVQSDIAGQQGKIAGFGTDEAYADALKAQDKADADYQRQQTLDPTEARIQIEELRRQIAELDAQLQPLDAVQAGQKPYGNELWDARQKQKDRLEAQLRQLEGDLEAMERRQQLAQYGKYTDEADFGLNSRFNYNYRDGSEGSTIAYIPPGEEASYGFTGGATTTGMDDADVLYGYVNRVQDVINANQSEIYAGRGDPLASDNYLVAIEMTDEERSIFNYLFNTGRQEEAQKYFELLTPDLNYRYRASEEARYRQMAEEDPIVTSLLTVLTSPDKMITLGGQALDYIEDGKIDEDAPYNMYSHIPTAVRGQVSQMVEKKYGKAGSFGYQTGMSILDNVYQMAITGGASGEGFMLAIMGSGAAADSVLAAKARGLTDDRAFALGLVSGAVEAITEKIGLDAFYDGIIGGKTALRAMLQSTLAEGSEEIASEVLDDIADMIIAGVDSERIKLINEYKAQGMSDSEAVGAAFVDLLKSAGVAGLGGALSGLLMSGGAQALMNSYNAVAQKTSQRAETKASLRAAENGLRELREQGYGAEFEAELAEQRATARELAPSAQTAAEEGTDILPTENAAESLQRAQSEAVPSVTPEQRAAALQGLQSMAATLGENGGKAMTANYDESSPVRMDDYVRDFSALYNAAREGKALPEQTPYLTQTQQRAAYNAGIADWAQTLQTEQNAPIMETERTAAPAVAQEAAQTAVEVTPYKQAQFEALQSAEVTSEYIEPITSPEQIKTYAEAVAADRADFGSTIDFDLEAAEQALSSGEITVYSPRAITAGSYVTPSRMNAEDAATGGGRIYSMTVPLDAVAWTDAFSGQYTGEMEGIANGREGDSILSRGGERYDRARAGEQAEGMVGGAEEAQGGNGRGQAAATRSENGGSPAQQNTEQAVKHTADLGIKDGSTTDSIRLVTERSSEDMKRAQALADEHGLKLVVFEGGDLHVGDTTARACITNGTIYARADHPHFSLYQLVKHEVTHDLIDRGEIDEGVVRERIVALYGEGSVQAVARLYASGYKGMTAEQAWTEMVCDAEADMNVFEKEFGATNKVYQKFLDDVKAASVNSSSTERGPPRGEAQYSRSKKKDYVFRDHGYKQSDIDYVEWKMRQEAQTTDQYLDDETKWLNAKSKGEHYFVIYGISDEAGPTALYASIGENADIDYRAFTENEEVFKSGDFRNWSDINRGFKAYRNKARSAGHSVSNAEDGRAKRENVRIPSGTQDSNRGADTDRSEENSGDITHFSMESPVEESDRLIAWHNMSASALESALELGGLAMPSFAIKPAENGHYSYGPISIIANKESVAPGRDQSIYGGDAWTPVFPPVENKVTYEAAEKLSNTVNGLLEKAGTNNREMDLHLDDSNIADKLDRTRQSFADAYHDKDGLKLAFLTDTGRKVVVPMRTQGYSVEPSTLRTLAKKFGDVWPGSDIMQYEPAIRDILYRAAEAQHPDQTVFGKSYAEALYGKELSFSKVDSILREAHDVKQNGIRKVVDKQSLAKRIETAMRSSAVKAEYDAWLKNLSEGIVEKRGIRKNIGLFDFKGNRRSFEQMHYDYTLENIIRSMKGQPKQGRTQFLSGPGSTKGAALKSYRNIEEVRSDIGRILPEDSEEAKAAYDHFNDAVAETSKYISPDDWLNGSDMIADILNNAKTYDGIMRFLRKEYGFLETQDHLDLSRIAREIVSIAEEANTLPMEYFESKVYRAFPFSEAAGVVVPSNLSQELIDKLKEQGANVLTYEAGNDEDRLAKVNSVEGARFSASLLDLESLEEQNEQLRKDLQATTEALAKAQSKAEYWEGQTKRSKAPSPNPTDINRLAHDIIGSTDTNLKANDIKPELTELAEFIMRGGDGKNELTFSGVKERAVGIAHRMLENYSELLDSAAVTDYKEIRKRIRDYGTIQVPGNDLPPDWTDWKRRNGWLRVAVSTGTPLDVVYSDLSESYPWIFPPDANPGSDQLYALVDGVRAAEPSYWNPNDENMAAATEYLANRIIDGVIEDVSQNKTFADRAAKRLSDLRIDSKEKLEAQKAELQRAVRETRARSDERLNNLKAHYKEVQENARQRKAEGNMRTRLLKIAKRLQDKKLPTPSRALVNEYVGYIDTVAKNMTGKTRDKLQALSELYNYELENNPDFTRDEAIEKKLSRLNAVRISDLTVEQVQDLIDVLLGLEHQLNNAKRELDSADRRDVYQKGVQIISDVKGGHTVKPQYMEKLDDFFVRNTLSPLRELRRQTGYVDDDPLYAAAQRLDRGQLRMNDYVMKNSKTFDEWVQDKTFMEELTGKKAKTIKVRGLGMNGQPVTVEITPDMRISLYLHNKNLQNQQHIGSMSGGIKVPDIKLYRQGKIADAYAKGTRIRLQPSEIRAICENMTAKEKALAERIYKYFNVTSRNALSDEFERLKGYMMRFVEDYFPIDTDGNFTKTNAEAINFDGSLEGSGWLKDRVAGAKNPIMLYDATSVLLKAIQAHGQFVGLAVPIRDFNKLYSMSGPVYDEAKNRIGSQSVKETIKQTWGTGATDYIDKMLGDLQKTHTESNSWTDLFRQIRSNYAGATLALNLSVALKQAGSYPTAAAVLGWKPLARAMADFGKVDLDYIASLTPLQWLRSQGYSTPELGDLKAKGKQLPPALNWIQGMDLLTTRKLWKACEYYMQENHPDLKRGSDQYNGTISELYNRVIEETQPNYTVMQRPQLLRSNNELLRDVSMFKTQLFQNFNIAYDAFGNMAAKHQQYQANPNAETKAKYEEAKKNAGRASSALIVQSVVIAAMTLAWNALRGKLNRYKDKEKDEITGWSFAKRFGLDVASGFFSTVPFGSEIFSMISSKLTGDKWYGFEGVTTGALTDFFSTIMSAYDQIGKSLEASKGSDTAAIQKQVLAWEDIAENTAKVFGIPAENVMNLIKGVYGSITKTACGKYYGEYLSMLATTPIENNKGKYYDLLYNAEKSGNMDQFWEIYNSMVALDAMASEKKSTVENIDAALKQREKKDK